MLDRLRRGHDAARGGRPSGAIVQHCTLGNPPPRPRREPDPPAVQVPGKQVDLGSTTTCVGGDVAAERSWLARCSALLDQIADHAFVPAACIIQRVERLGSKALPAGQQSDLRSGCRGW